jgi:hypothetical protein
MKVQTVRGQNCIGREDSDRPTMLLRHLYQHACRHWNRGTVSVSEISGRRSDLNQFYRALASQ